MKVCPSCGYVEKSTQFILRLPECYTVALDNRVAQGEAKSRNALIVEVIVAFLKAKQ